jgi:formiminotetrahydrofolate cyclodeaminase
LKQSKAIPSWFAKGSPNSIPHYWAVETIEAYLKGLSSAQPTPGGGSAATIVAALGAALIAMVARITLTNAKLTERHDLAAELVAEADALRAHLAAARERDERAYGAVVHARAQPRTTPEEQAARSAALEQALCAAAAEPLGAANLSLRVVELARRALGLQNTNLISDVACAAEFGFSALAACAFNVRINHKFMKEASVVARQEAELRACEDLAAGILPGIRSETNRLLQAS